MLMPKKSWQIVVPKDFETTNKEYKINGKSYYRVTETIGIIAKHGLRNWMGRVGYAKANKILETRQNIGIHVHKLIELTLQGKDLNLGTYETEIREGMCKFHEFKDLAKLIPEGLEQRLWSNKHGYAGTADYIGRYTTPIKFLVGTRQSGKIVKLPKFEKSALVIGDWKTGRDVYPEYWLQLAAYAMAFKELTGIQVKGAFITLIRDGKLKVKEKTWAELEVAFKHYMCALELYKGKYQYKDYCELR
jgi:hypothetical protein